MSFPRISTQCFRLSLLLLQFPLVSAGMKGLNTHMPSNEESLKTD